MYVCTNCGKECKTKMVDFGIGSFEHFGSHGFDSNICEVSACCEEEVNEVDEDDSDIEYRDTPEEVKRTKRNVSLFFRELSEMSELKRHNYKKDRFD